MPVPAESAWLVPLVAAVAAAALAAWILVRPWAEDFYRALAAALLLTAVVQASNAAFLLFEGTALVFRRLALSAELLRMAALFALGGALIGRTAAEADPSATRRSRLAGAGALVGVVLVWIGSFAGTAESGDVVLDFLGRPVFALLLLGLVMAVAQLELVLRTSEDPFRYRIKFVILGIAAIPGFEIYMSAQALLLGEWRSHQAVVGAVVGLLAIATTAFGLGRMRLARTLGRVAVSPQMVYGSFTLLGVGLYLLGVGLIGEVLRLAGQPYSLGAAELVVFTLTMVLVVGAFSRSARARFRVLVSRHFLRSRYDYRTKWLEVTDEFRTAESAEEILDRLLTLLARTFGTGRLSVWVRYEADDRFHQVRSTNIEPPPLPLPATHPLVAALAVADAPVEIRAIVPAGDQEFRDKTEAVLGVPVLGAGELLAFIVLGPGPAGRGYDVDDRDLLRTIAHHAGVLLAHARLADERQAAAEIDALNRFAAFYLHDFKNLTARLSLVAQNAARHADDPEFRASAMTTVERTARQMTDLIARLSRRSPDLGRLEPVDVGALVRGTVESLGPGVASAHSHSSNGLPSVLAVPEQLQQVVLNLVLNARKALEGVPGASPVRVEVSPDGGERVRLVVSDEGPGIPPERLGTLFQPFRSGDSGGFGIGLYESKRIVESYGGSLRVDSAPGRGTRVVVELPAVAPGAAVGQTAHSAKERES